MSTKLCIGYAHVVFPVRTPPRSDTIKQFQESKSVSYKKPNTRKSVAEGEGNVFSIVGSVIQNHNINHNK